MHFVSVWRTERLQPLDFLFSFLFSFSLPYPSGSCLNQGNSRGTLHAHSLNIKKAAKILYQSLRRHIEDECEKTLRVHLVQVLVT